MTGCIGGRQGKHHTEGCFVWSREIVTGQTSGHIVTRKESQAEGARNVVEEEDEYEVAPSLATVSRHVVVEVDAGEN